MKIVTDKSFAHITHSTVEDEDFLEEILTVPYINNNLFTKDKNEVYTMYTAGAKQFPLGLLAIVEKYWCTPITITDVPEIKLTGRILLGKDEPYAFQYDIIKEACKRKRGYIEVGTGGGKSVMLGALSKVFPKPIAVLVHSAEIHRMLTKSLKDWGLSTCANPSEEDLYKKDIDVFVCMERTLGNRFSDNQKYENWWKTHIQTIFVDECHHIQADNYQRLMIEAGARYRIGFTATMPKTTTKSFWDIVKWFGGCLGKENIKELSDKGHVVPVCMNILKFKHNDGISTPIWMECVKDAKVQWEIKRNELVAEINNTADTTKRNSLKRKLYFYKKDLMYGNNFSSKVAQAVVTASYYARLVNSEIVNNEARNKLIVEQTTIGNGVLIVVDKVEHGNILEAMLSWTNAKYVHGTKKNRQEYLDSLASGEIRCLIATKIIDEGINIHGITKIILAGGGKSKRQLIQRIGRGVRKAAGKTHVDIVDIYDVGQRLLEKHSKERVKVYKECGFEIKILT